MSRAGAAAAMQGRRRALAGGGAVAPEVAITSIAFAWDHRSPTMTGETWEDLVDGLELSQPTSGARPSAGSIDGKGTLTFDGVDDSMEVGGNVSNVIGSNDFALVFVAKLLNAVAGSGTSSSDATLWCDSQGWFGQSVTEQANGPRLWRWTGPEIENPIALADDDPLLLESGWDSGTGGTWSSRINGGSVVQVTGTGALSRSGSFRIANGWTSGTRLQVEIAAIYAFHAALTTPDRDALDAWVAQEWPSLV